jgi:hypothetical protein
MSSLAKTPMRPRRWPGPKPTAAHSWPPCSPRLPCYAVNPLQALDIGNATACPAPRATPPTRTFLADMVRTHADQLRSIAADSSEAQAIKVVAACTRR